METTYANASAKVETEKKLNGKISLDGKTSRKALIGFLSGSAIVYGAAVYYCATTEHVGAAFFLAITFVFYGIFAASIYKSFK